MTCNFTVDNRLLGVYYNNKPLDATGNWDFYPSQKTITFETEGNGYGEIKVKGTDNNDRGHCILGGLVMLCKTSDGQGPWHNFKTDLIHWRSEEYYELCSNDQGMVSDHSLSLPSLQFLVPMVNAGAEKIWSNEKENTLIGSPYPTGK